MKKLEQQSQNLKDCHKQCDLEIYEHQEQPTERIILPKQEQDFPKLCVQRKKKISIKFSYHSLSSLHCCSANTLAYIYPCTSNPTY
jgi:hypothetical protein